MSQPPNNRFLSAPAYHVPATGMRVVEVPAPLPLPGPEARLTIRPRPGREGHSFVTLTKELLRAIPHLKAGAPVDVVAPMRRGGPWHLDTRPTATRRVPVVAPGKLTRFTIPRVSSEHYLAPAVDTRPGVFGGLNGSAGLVPALHFALGPVVDGHPGYFTLLPLR